MTIGIGSYSPNGRFSFPRSYIAEVINCTAGFSLTQNVNEFSLSFHPIFPSVYHWTFNLKFWLWSSNVWSLDHIITESYYVDTPNPTQIPLNFALYWVRQAPDFKPSLRFAPNLSTVNPVVAALPIYPPGYWARPT